MARLYIAGPMRGHLLHGFPAFFEAALKLRRRGHVVHNPADYDMAQGFNPALDIDDPAQIVKLSLPDVLRQDAHLILDSDGIVLLPGWETSEGAKFEYVLARMTGRKVFTFAAGAEDPLVVLPESVVAHISIEESVRIWKLPAEDIDLGEDAVRTGDWP